jgi:hypothetical protein
MKKTLITSILSISFFSFAWVAFALPVPADFIHNNNANRVIDLNVNPAVGNGAVLGEPPVINLKAGTLMMHDRLLMRLGKVKTRVEENRTLSSQEKHKVLSIVKDYKKVFEVRREQTESGPALDQFSANSERNISAGLWNDGSVRIHAATIKGRIADRQNILNKANAVVAKLEIYIKLAKKGGMQTDTAENNLAKIKVDLVSVETYLKEASLAVDKTAGGSDWDDAKVFFKAANKSLKKANENIKEARLLSKEVVTELRKAIK